MKDKISFVLNAFQVSHSEGIRLITIVDSANLGKYVAQLFLCRLLQQATDLLQYFSRGK